MSQPLTWDIRLLIQTCRAKKALIDCLHKETQHRVRTQTTNHTSNFRFHTVTSEESLDALVFEIL